MTLVRDKTQSPVYPRHRRQLVIATVGAALEMYDWVIYSTLAVYIAAQFFPADDPLNALLSVLMIFAVGFFARPIGALIIGALADRRGRRFALIVSMLLLGAGSALIAVAPTASMVGGWAGFILVFARLLQGLGYGGETGPAVAFVGEIAPAERRGLYGAIGFLGGTIAVIIATGASVLLSLLFSAEEIDAWAWRLPILLGVVFTFYAVYLRRGLTETGWTAHDASGVHASSVVSSSSLSTNSWRILFVKHWRKVIIAVALVAGGTFSYNIYVLGYATLAHAMTGVDIEISQAVSLGSLVLLAAMQLFFGWLSDRVGRKKILIGALAFSAVVIWPCILLLNGESVQFFALQCIGFVPVAAIIAVTNSVMAELFPRRVRGVGSGFPYSVSIALFGGTAPYLVTLFSSTGNAVAVCLYGTALIVLSLVATLFVREMAGKPLPV